MKSEEVKFPSASRAPANPMIRTATTTSPEPCRKSRSVNGGGAASPRARRSRTGRAAFGQALAYRAMMVRSPGWSATSSSSRDGPGRRVRDRASAHRPRHHLVRARRLDAVAGLLAGDDLLGPLDDLGRHRLGPAAGFARGAPSISAAPLPDPRAGPLGSSRWSPGTAAGPATPSAGSGERSRSRPWPPRRRSARRLPSRARRRGGVAGPCCWGSRPCSY